jgi:DNA-binding NarL/FixJ family response regulator
VPRILIADDSPASRQALRNVLETSGWEVCGEAENGLEAIEKAATLKPDLVILDWSMPKMSGIAAARTIQAADPQMPLLLFTLDKIVPALADEARGAGFRGALAKSEGVFALTQAVEDLLKGKTFFLTESNVSVSESPIERTTNRLIEGKSDADPEKNRRNSRISRRRPDGRPS